MNKEATAHELLRYLATHFVGKGVALGAGTSLFEERLLDSVRLIELIDYVEKTYSVRVSPMEIVLENFDSVDKITDYLGRKGVLH